MITSKINVNKMFALTCHCYLFLFVFYSRNSTRPILIPLPYIRSDIGMPATPGKQQKPMYNMPYIYSSKTNKAATQQSDTPSNAMPAVINFNPMNIPELSRPGTKNGIPVASKISALNKSNSGIAVHDVSARTSFPAPFLSSPGPFKGTTPNQTPALFDDRPEDENDAKEKLAKLDIESVDSEVDSPVQPVAEGTAAAVEIDLSGNSADSEGEEGTVVDMKEKTNGEHPGEEIVAKGIRFSLTTDGGLMEGVEIYDYEKRGRGLFAIECPSTLILFNSYT